MKNSLQLILATTVAATLTMAPSVYANQNNGTESSRRIGDVSKASSEVIAGVVVKASGSIMMLSEKGIDLSSQVATGAFNLAHGISVKAVGMSEKSVTMILDFSKKGSQSASNAAVSAVTASGQLIPASLTAVGDAMVVSVKATSKGVSTVFDASSKVVVGSVKWTSDALITSGQFIMNAAGQLVDASGKVVGYVVDLSGQAVKLVVEASGKIATVIGDGSEVVITGSTESLKSVGTALLDISTRTGDLISDLFEASMKVSKMGSLVVVTIVEKTSGAVQGSLRFSSQTITQLFESMVSKQSEN